MVFGRDLLLLVLRRRTVRRVAVGDDVIKGRRDLARMVGHLELPDARGAWIHQRNSTPRAVC